MCSQLFALLLLALSLTLVTSQQRPRLSRSHPTQTSKHSDESLKSTEQDSSEVNRHTHTFKGHCQTNINEQVKQDLSNVIKAMQKIFLQMEALAKNQDYRNTETKNWRKIPEYHLQFEKKNWFEAFADCRKKNMDLATFENQDEFQDVLKKIQDCKNNHQKECNASTTYFWLSAMNFTDKKVYVWISSSKDKDFEDWCPKEPNRFLNVTTKETENCVQLKHQREHKCMNDYFCSEPLNYICENRTDDVPTTTDSKTNKTFEVCTDQKNWFGALVACRKKGMRLASLDGGEKDEHLKRELANLQKEFLTNSTGTGKDIRNGEFWLSGSDLGRTGHNVWMTTGESVRHNVSGVGLPNNIEVHCVKMNLNGTLYNCPCHWRFYYICENQKDVLDIKK